MAEEEHTSGLVRRLTRGSDGELQPERAVSLDDLFTLVAGREIRGAFALAQFSQEPGLPTAMGAGPTWPGSAVLDKALKLTIVHDASQALLLTQRIGAWRRSTPAATAAALFTSPAVLDNAKVDFLQDVSFGEREIAKALGLGVDGCGTQYRVAVDLFGRMQAVHASLLLGGAFHEARLPLPCSSCPAAACHRERRISLKPRT